MRLSAGNCSRRPILLLGFQEAQSFPAAWSPFVDFVGRRKATGLNASACVDVRSIAWGQVTVNSGFQHRRRWVDDQNVTFLMANLYGTVSSPGSPVWPTFDLVRSFAYLKRTGLPQR